MKYNKQKRICIINPYLNYITRRKTINSLKLTTMLKVDVLFLKYPMKADMSLKKETKSNKSVENWKVEI